MWDERAKAAIDRSRNGSTGSAIMAQLLAAANMGIAFEDFVSSRKSFATDDKPHNDLFAIRPMVARVATLGFRYEIGFPFEVGACQVIQQGFFRLYSG